LAAEFATNRAGTEGVGVAVGDADTLSLQHSTPPAAGEDFVTTYASHSPEPLSVQNHGLGSEPHKLPEKALSGAHAELGPAPMFPQPNTSLEIAAVCAHPVLQLEGVHCGPISVPVAHTPHPVDDCLVTKKTDVPAGAAPSHPVEERAITSAELSHTCQPSAQRSATLHPVPLGLLLSLPAWRPQAGSVVSKVATVGQSGAAPGLNPRTPGILQPPAHPAISG
jgi:hypothetical protein